MERTQGRKEGRKEGRKRMRNKGNIKIIEKTEKV